MKGIIGLIFMVAFIAIMLPGGCSGPSRQYVVRDEDGNIVEMPDFQNDNAWLIE